MRLGPTLEFLASTRRLSEVLFVRLGARTEVNSGYDSSLVYTNVQTGW
jgi:hypothetical protein